MTSIPGTTLTDAVAHSLREACARSLDFAEQIRCGHEAISRAVTDGLDLDTMWRESDPDKRLPGNYRRHQVVTDERFGFTVVVLLWEPGACTPIHDHDTWCVFGLLQGRLEVTNYTVTADDGKGPLRLSEVSRAHLEDGVIGDNGGADTEVHRVRNTGTERAISLHVYGKDLTKRTLFDGRGIMVDGKESCFAFQDAPAY
ncbi:MAG: cysteine dioxygenase family protein [Planctomycetota bacterium]|jgi:predicted metal-dependent enzyme (double-stranded beta helix superfamily)